MVVRAKTKIVDPLSEKLPGGRISVKIFYQEQEFPTKCLEVIQLHARPCGYIGVPVILFMVFDINRYNRSH
jgi:hypothetical protein